ncbi:hypothetical protein [uncultured Kriegella sp.]|mgnify:CR=1 FL=1|uniref:hypothetical protein n=1 Tax=uncultured Kriegella sp. TaxID=1798910 RepID=UPI0030D8D184|tara:strand:- start:1367 stop:2086 length:720 start_codon:yes stop_codon:yes gene_type:complete
MKKVNIGLLKLLSLSVLFLSLTSSKCEDDNVVTDPNTNAEPPKQIVTIEHAKEMYDSYGKHRVPLIQTYEDNGRSTDKTEAQAEEATKFDVARYVYYDYDTIKQYLEYIEKEAAAADVEISQLRFYFSNYPDKDKFPDGRPVVHPKQNSVMISPTIKKGERDYIFYTADGEGGKREAVLLSDNFDKYPNQETGYREEPSFRNEASVLPNLSVAHPKPAPVFFGNKSVTMNEGNSAPPPH